MLFIYSRLIPVVTNTGLDMLFLYEKPRCSSIAINPELTSHQTDFYSVQ